MSPELIGPFPDGVDPEAYDRLRRRVLWSFPTGLFVIGSTGVLQGVRHHNLMTANLVVQVATAPKLVAAAIETEARTARLVRAHGAFSVSALDRTDRTVVRRFVKPVEAIELDAQGRPATMAGEGVTVAQTGAPILNRAVAWVDCSVRELLELGSHLLAIGEVVAAGGRPGEAEVLRMEDTKMNYGG